MYERGHAPWLKLVVGERSEIYCFHYRDLHNGVFHADAAFPAYVFPGPLHFRIPISSVICGDISNG